MENLEIREKKITVIPAKSRAEIYNIPNVTKERVCAYCRVSTDREEQESSFENQREYYEKYIMSNPNWEFVGIYADEGISGKAMNNRADFLRMLNDCKIGKIDKIVCKTVSRFARNKTQCLTEVRNLKSIGIGVFFETQSLDTLTPGTDLVLSIHAALAEEDSRTLANNIRWTFKKKFENNVCDFNTGNMIGYSKDENKNIIIVPEEADIIRRICREYLSGRTYAEIAKRLTDEGIKRPRGNGKWAVSTIKSILTNEKYRGDCILQKTYSPDFLIPRKKNIGQADQKYITDSHVAIISRDTADEVTAEIARRKELRSVTKSGHGKYSTKYPLSSKVFCGCCGSKMRRHAQWRGNNHVPVWTCLARQTDKTSNCIEKPIKETDIINAYLKCIEKLVGDKEDFCEKLKLNIADCLDDSLQLNIDKAEETLNNLQEDMLELQRQFRNSVIDRQIYDIKHAKLASEIDNTLNSRSALISQSESLKLAKYRIEEITELLSKDKLSKTFDETQFTKLIEKVIVHNKHSIEFVFKAGFIEKIDI